MKYQLSNKWKWIYLLGVILYAAIFLFSCLSPYLSPCDYHWVTFAALLFPFLLLGWVLLIIPLTIFFFRKSGWLLILFLIPAWKNASMVLGTNPAQNFQVQKEKGQIRILSWNVDAFLYRPYLGPISPEKQQAMIQFIREMDADILCFQDFAQTPPEFGKVNIRFLSDSLRYPYYYFSDDGGNYGTIIFSRFPVIDSGRTKYKEKVFPESIAFVDVQAGKDTMRIYNTHLRSMNLHKEIITRDNIGYIEFVKEDTAVLFHSNRMERMMYFDCIHTSQAKLIREKLDETKKPFVFCADLNSVPSSYVYNTIQEGLTDAFLARGFGWGATYHKFSPSLRIDVMLMSKQWSTVQYYAPKLPLSDHFPIVTDMQLHN